MRCGSWQCMYGCRYGMIEAISHLIHRDYEAIVQDFITLRFIPRGEISPWVSAKSSFIVLSFIPHSSSSGMIMSERHCYLHVCWPAGTDLRPILPVLAKVFDQALEGGQPRLSSPLAPVKYAELLCFLHHHMSSGSQ